VVRELRHYATAAPFAGRRVATVYFGGGTPSLFAPDSIARVLDAAAEGFGVEAGAEVTLEANPEDLSAERLTGLRARGVNRLSIGIQSFVPRHLRRLGRGHTAGDVARAVPAARDAGFDNVSLDLMFAIPDQTPGEWRSDLDAAIALRPDHVSVYGLTYEERTPFHALRNDGRLAPIDEETEHAMFVEARERLGAAGYHAYEISNFARAGFESRHNRNYWRCGDYLGLGAGAHSHAAGSEGARRWWNVRAPEEYVAATLASGAAIDSEERLDSRASASEFFFLALRTCEGADGAEFRARFGREIDEEFPRIAGLVADGLLERDRTRVRLTARGLLLADSVTVAAS
jgi:oxygen-independent coproporphyrinogen-3 oxidase